MKETAVSIGAQVSFYGGASTGARPLNYTWNLRNGEVAILRSYILPRSKKCLDFHARLSVNLVEALTLGADFFDFAVDEVPGPRFFRVAAGLDGADAVLESVTVGRRVWAYIRAAEVDDVFSPARGPNGFIASSPRRDERSMAPEKSPYQTLPSSSK